MDGETNAGLPAGWAWARLGEVGEVTGGLTKNPQRSSWSGRVPYLRVANVQEGWLDLRDVHSIGVQPSELPRVLLQPDDLLVVEGNGSLDQLGRCAIWSGAIEGCVHQNHIIKVRFREGCSVHWAFHWLTSAQGRRFIERVASSTSGLHTLSISKISSLPIPVAPPSEQDRILTAVGASSAELDEAEAALTRARKQLTDLRTSLLHAAFSGRLVPQRPEDEEPATVLLARLRTEAVAARRVRRARSVPPEPGQKTLLA